MFQMLLSDEDQWADDHDIRVGYCNQHNVKVWDASCDECEDERFLLVDGWLQCEECGEDRYEDARLENGLKCGVCAYG